MMDTNTSSFIDIIFQQWESVTWLEWVSTLSQIASVFYAQRNNVWVYPTGIIGVLFAAYLYFFVAHPPLYAEGSVHIYYFGMSCYGWWVWTRKNQSQEHMYPITYTSTREKINAVLLWTISWVLLYVILAFATDSNTPLGDSAVSASAITAMWLMALRKIENWWLWIFSNLVAIPLHIYKGFYLFALMFFLFLVMAIIGHFRWARQVNHQS